MKCYGKSSYRGAKRRILRVFDLGKSLFGNIGCIISFRVFHPFFCDQLAQIVPEAGFILLKNIFQSKTVLLFLPASGGDLGEIKL